jgi:3-hydroxyisobutyrate dehydrogenase
VGFIGLGAMGWPMAGRLAMAGFDVTGLDLDSERAWAFAEQFGAKAAATPGQAAANADVIVTMLLNSAIVESVVLGEGGAAFNAKPGAIFLEMSSGNPKRTAAIAHTLSAAQLDMVDAPVSGGVNRPRFYAHLPLREGWRDGDQVPREHQGQGGAAGP